MRTETKALEAPPRLPGQQPPQPRADRDPQDNPRKPPAVAIGQGVQVVTTIFAEGLMVPKRGQVALRHRFDRLHLDRTPNLTPARIEVGAWDLGRGLGFAGNKAVINSPSPATNRASAGTNSPCRTTN